jgi:hypothetical protein
MEGKKAPRGKKNTNNMEVEDISKIQENAKHTIKYKYTTFDDLKEQGEYNFYAIIYDASFPQEEYSSESDKKKNIPKYFCILKLIDQTTNCLTNQNNFNENVIYLIIKSTEKENVPYVHHIGDIIRVHRGFYAPKKKRNVYVNVCKDNKIKGSWCLYSTNNNSTEPYSCSNKKFNVETQDKQIIENTKAWVKNYLNIDKSLKYPLQVNLINRINDGNDNDLLVHVVKKIELNDQIVLFIQDATDGCELHTYKYYNFIQENDIIRVRSYKVFDNNNLIINEFGNILILPQNSSCYKGLINDMTKKLKQIK